MCSFRLFFNLYGPSNSRKNFAVVLFNVLPTVFVFKMILSPSRNFRVLWGPLNFWVLFSEILFTLPVDVWNYILLIAHVPEMGFQLRWWLVPDVKYLRLLWILFAMFIPFHHVPPEGVGRLYVLYSEVVLLYGHYPTGQAVIVELTFQHNYSALLSVLI